MTGEGIAPRFTSSDFELPGHNWEISGTCTTTLDAIAWEIKAEPRLAEVHEESWLSFSFPQNGRDKVSRFHLTGNSSTRFSYTAGPDLLINPKNRYDLRVTLSSESGNVDTTVAIRGNESDILDFARPIPSSQVEHSIIGTATHFNFGQSGAFRGWRQYETLIDRIADSGIKWIRDGTRVEKLENGEYKLREWDRQWLTYARSKELKVILVIGMNARDTAEDFAVYAEAFVRETREFCDVFELGNEPNNFGKWRETYGGPWNGKEADNSTSPWVVEHLKNTNAAADAIKKAFPEVTLIGLGASSPTNHRYLELGVSASVDGIVDHPYTYCLPPERLPFNKNMLERDGVLAVTDNGSYDNLIETYLDQFKKNGMNRTLWFTEFGFPGHWHDGTNEKGLYAGFTEEAQAIYLVRRFLHTMAFPQVKVACQYDFLDDYGSKSTNAEANFGLLRSDLSPKPAYYAISRVAAVTNGYAINDKFKLESIDAPLHRAARQGYLVEDWDGTEIGSDNGVKIQAFSSEKTDHPPFLAIWSTQALDAQFNCRSISFNLNWPLESDVPVVALDLMTGKSFDIQVKAVDGMTRFEGVQLGRNPIIVYLPEKGTKGVDVATQVPTN